MSWYAWSYNNSSILFITTVIRGKAFTTVSVAELQIIYRLSWLPHDSHNTQPNIHQQAAGVARAEIHGGKRGYHLFLKHSSLYMSLSNFTYSGYIPNFSQRNKVVKKNNRQSNSGFAL